MGRVVERAHGHFLCSQSQTRVVLLIGIDVSQKYLINLLLFFVGQSREIPVHGLHDGTQEQSFLRVFREYLRNVLYAALKVTESLECAFGELWLGLHDVYDL